MAKPSKQAIELALTEWLRLQVKAMKISSTLATDIQPFKDNFERRTKPFVEAANEKLKPLNQRMAQLSAEIEKEMRRGVDEEAGTIALGQVRIGLSQAGRTAIAEIVKEEGDRVIDAQKFFEFVLAKDRTPKFWNCIKVKIGETVKFLGSQIDSLAKKPMVFKFKISSPDEQFDE